MRYPFIEAHRGEFPVRLMCKVLRVSHGGYYGWRRRPKSMLRRWQERLSGLIREIFEEFRGIYGSPRIYRELGKRGISCSKKTVAKLMRSMSLRSKRKKRFKPTTTDSDHHLETAPNQLDRQFSRALPNEAWAADITYVRTDEGWLYLAVVLDLYSRRVIGWSMADHMRSELITDATRMAIETRSGSSLDGLLHHSDRGVQYASDACQELLAGEGIVCSMSRKGNCWDNAVVESFFGTLKLELVSHERYATRAAAKQSIFEYIEVFYNRKRMHSTLGYVSPVEFEQRTG